MYPPRTYLHNLVLMRQKINLSAGSSTWLLESADSSGPEFSLPASNVPKQELYGSVANLAPSVPVTSVVDPHHADADPDSTYHPDADPDSTYHPDADPD